MQGHKLDILKDALTEQAHVDFLETQEFELFAELLQVDILQAILGDFKWRMHITIDDTAF